MHFNRPGAGLWRDLQSGECGRRRWGRGNRKCDRAGRSNSKYKVFHQSSISSPALEKHLKEIRSCEAAVTGEQNSEWMFSVPAANEFFAASSSSPVKRMMAMTPVVPAVMIVSRVRVPIDRLAREVMWRSTVILMRIKKRRPGNVTQDLRARAMPSRRPPIVMTGLPHFDAVGFHEGRQTMARSGNRLRCESSGT